MLRLVMYAMNDGNWGPDVALTGDPSIDNTTVATAGFYGGVIVALAVSATSGRGTVLQVCDTEKSGAGQIPFGVLLNGPGEFAGAIGPSGSGKLSIVRAKPEYLVDVQAYLSTDTFVVGAYVYCGGAGNKGLHTAEVSSGSGAYVQPIGIVTSIPTASFPWLGVASFI